MAQYGFFFDQSRCYACQACSVACKDWNGVSPGPEKWMTVYEWETGSFPQTRIHSLAFACGHCENPVCLDACSVGAIFKEEKYGAVLVDSDKCVGCRECHNACPYGAPKFADDSPDAKMTKCTMCIDRLEVGEKPICVLSCPMRALDFDTMDNLVDRYGDRRQLDGMPSPEGVRPAFVCRPMQDRKDLVSYDVKKALQLNADRLGGELLYEDVDEVLDIPDDLMSRNVLKMVHGDSESLMKATRNDLG